LSVLVCSVGGVIVIEPEVFTAPRNHLENAAFARKLTGHYQAIELEQLADYARTTTGLDAMFTHLDVAARLHISDRAAQHRIRFALTLTTRLPATLATLKQGCIEEYKAQLIADAVEPLSAEHALAVEARVLDQAPTQTPTQLRNALAKAVLAVDPQGAEERRQERVRGRRVESRPTEEGMAMLTLHHTADRIAAAHALIKTRAKELKAAGGESRTLSQLEADVAADLLLGIDGGGRTVEVHLTIPATSLVGADNQPGEVEGLPITAQAARELAAAADRWRWVRTDPKTGQVVDLTSPRYKPPIALTQFVKIRDRTCRFVGCTRRARYCEVDHRIPWPQGKTCDANCSCLCQRHHKAKHEGGWQVKPSSKPGWVEWTSPLGITHLVPPEPATETPPPPTPRRPEDDPPPF
jgi:hypothetical protein